MECKDVDKLKPLDKLLDDKIREFESGEEKKCDKDLDVMIWELGDYENEEPRQEAGEFKEAPPMEEELVEKRSIHGAKGLPSYMTEEDVTTGHSIRPETRKGKGKAVGGPRKKKK